MGAYSFVCLLATSSLVHFSEHFHVSVLSTLTKYRIGYMSFSLHVQMINCPQTFFMYNVPLLNVTTQKSLFHHSYVVLNLWKGFKIMAIVNEQMPMQSCMNEAFYWNIDQRFFSFNNEWIWKQRHLLEYDCKFFYLRYRKKMCLCYVVCSRVNFTDGFCIGMVLI